MQRIPVESSDIVSIGYDAVSQMLEVEFGGGRIYRYRDVEPDVYEKFLKASSFGQYFFAHINGRYRYEKISESKKTKARKGGPIIFATGNRAKVQDFQASCAHFDIQVEQRAVALPEIQSSDPEEVAVHKAKSAYSLLKEPVVVNDSFWNILALRGFPGAYMNDLSRWLKAEDFLKLLESYDDRSVILTETYVFYDGKRTKVFSKEHRGRIATEPRGEGLSIRQIAIFGNSNLTLAEHDETNAVEIPGLGSKDWAGYELAKWLHMQRRLRLI